MSCCCACPVSGGVFWVLTTLGCAIPRSPRAPSEDPVNFVRLELDANVLPEWPPGILRIRRSSPMTRSGGCCWASPCREHRTAVQRWIGENRGACRCFVMEKLRFWCRQLVEALRLARKMSE